MIELSCLEVEETVKCFSSSSLDFPAKPFNYWVDCSVHSGFSVRQYILYSSDTLFW